MKKILKSILLWTTALTIMLFIGGIDSIVDKGLGVTLAWIELTSVEYIYQLEICILYPGINYFIDY